ncbi:hypothetical protein [Cycloclasticus pugetii]|uniref:hypothetical protein n=1 Tax=Cycloclasticus pugetii TaxID=34068 RepID=UPI00035CAADD|nr:hypothetical protein [Cycloclasticus pugetii]
MSSKLNVKDIVTGHIGTLVDAGKKSISFADMFSFYILPAIIAGFGIFFCFNISKEISSLLVNFGAIFTALLLSVLVLVYDQENKIDQNTDASLKNAKKSLLNHLYYNICYCIIMSVFLVVICLLHTVVEAFSPFMNIYFITPLIIVTAVNLILTILMIVKRMHVLLIS